MSDNEKIIDEILKIDKDIRYAGIFNIMNNEGKMQKGKKNYLTKQESDLAQKQAYIRWQTRKDQKPSIGEHICAVGEYEKIYRITIPLDDQNLILVSVEKTLEPFNVVKKIKTLVNSRMANL